MYMYVCTLLHTSYIHNIHTVHPYIYIHCKRMHKHNLDMPSDVQTLNLNEYLYVAHSAMARRLRLIRVWGRRGLRGYSRGRWWGLRRVRFGRGLQNTQWAAWPSGSCLEDGDKGRRAFKPSFQLAGFQNQDDEDSLTSENSFYQSDLAEHIEYNDYPFVNG